MSDRGSVGIWGAGVAVCTLAGALGLWIGADRPEPLRSTRPTVAPLAADAEVAEALRIGLFRRGPIPPSLQAAFLASEGRLDETAWVIAPRSDLAQNGVNLVVSGHGPGAAIVDMAGRVLHRWEGTRSGPRRGASDRALWTRAQLSEDGTVTAVVDGAKIVAMASDASVRWTASLHAHDAIEPLPDGGFVTAVRKRRRVDAEFRQAPISDEEITWIDPDGTVRRSLPLIAAYQNSPFADHWRDRPRRGTDVLHATAIQPLDAALADPLAGSPDGSFGAALRRGRVLLALRELGTLAVLDPEAGTIAWSVRPPLTPSDVTLLPTGRLLAYDGGRGKGRSRVVELDPETLAPTWSYDGGEDNPFFSIAGRAQRLDNGNTLITVTAEGRAFEITSSGEIVWSYYSPHRPPDRPAVVAALFEVARLPEGAWRSP